MRKVFITFIIALTSMLYLNGGLVRSDLAGRSIAYIQQEEGRVLPDGIIAVEYIESSGTQYIDTQFVPNKDTGIILDAAYKDDGIYGRLFGTQVDGYGKTIVLRRSSASGGDFYIQGGNPWKEVKYQFDMDRHLFKFNYPRTCYGIDDVILFNTSLGDVVHSCWLFGNNNVDYQLGQGKIYEFIVIDLNSREYLLDFVPCRFMNENDEIEGGFYDLVSKTVFRNQGTGSFTIGPDKE